MILNYIMKSSPEIFNPASGQGGFTLIELIMVMIFLTVAFTATIAMMTGSMEKSAESDILTQAIQLADKKMESIRADKQSLGYHHLINENYPVENNPDGMTGFKRSVAIVDYGAYKEIRVRVEHASIKPVVLVAQMANY